MQCVSPATEAHNQAQHTHTLSLVPAQFICMQPILAASQIWKMDVLEYLLCYTFLQRAVPLILIEPNYSFFFTPSPLSSVQNKCQCHSLSQTKCNQRHKSVMRPTGSATCALLCATGAGGAGTWLGSLLVQHCPLVARLRTDGYCLRQQNADFIHYFNRCN